MGIPIGGGYAVDLDTARQYVTRLHAGVDTLKEILVEMEQQSWVPPAGRDFASPVYQLSLINWVEQHRTWNVARQQELRALADTISASLRSYQETEQHSSIRGS